MEKHSSNQPNIRDIIAERVSRRGFLLGSATGLSAIAAQGFVGSLFSGEAVAQDVKSSLGFTELKRVYDDKHRVADMVVAWGDATAADLYAFDPAKLDAEAQTKRFG